MGMGKAGAGSKLGAEGTSMMVSPRANQLFKRRRHVMDFKAFTVSPF